MGIEMQFCGLVLLITVFILRLLQKGVHTENHRLYDIFLICGILCLFLDGYSLVVLQRAAGNYTFYVYFICKAYVIMLDVVCCLSFLYLSHDSESHIRGLSVIRKVSLIWCAGMSIVAAILPIYVYDQNGQLYTYGPCTLAVYVVCVGFEIANLVLLLSHKKDMSVRRWAAGMMWVVLWLLAAGIQFMHSELLLVGFAMSLGITIVFIQLETPDFKKLQETMQQLEVSKQEANQANEAKSSFLAQMSHEIRTPINAVIGMNEMILREAQEEHILEYASNAYNSGKALLSIINDILDISKIEAGRLEIIEAEYDVYSLLADCYNLTYDRCRKKKLEYVFQIDENIPCKLYGDVVHIRQIIVNYLTNAIKYTDSGSVEFILKGQQSRGLFEMQICVRDTGIGISEENIEKTFDRFQRFDLKRNQTTEGAGLGLAICKQLAELMGGSVRVESKYGEGSAFFCTVLQKIKNDAPIGKIDVNSFGQNRYAYERRKFTAENAKILVVDDVEMNLVVFSSLMKEHKVQIDKASGGMECLERIQEQKYDVIFMDHLMPEMDGLETFSKMREMSHFNQDTPVIMLTANALSGEREKYLQAGFSSYLTKPIQSDKLDETLLTFIPEDKIVWEKEGADTEEESSVKAAKTEEKQTEERKTEKKRTEEKQTEEPAWLKQDVDTEELCDFNIGLSYCNRDKEIFGEILESYFAGYSDNSNSLGMYAKEGDWENYTVKVHALKSTSRMIGANKLADQAAELERAGKNGNYDKIKAENDGLLNLYKKVYEVIEEALRRKKELNEDSQTEPEEISKEMLTECAEMIKEAVEGFDIDTITETLEKLSGCRFNGLDLGEAFADVKSAAANFDYEGVEAAVQLVMRKLL